MLGKDNDCQPGIFLVGTIHGQNLMCVHTLTYTCVKLPGEFAKDAFVLRILQLCQDLDSCESTQFSISLVGCA